MVEFVARQLSIGGETFSVILNGARSSVYLLISSYSDMKSNQIV